ncbi:hypothetical protein F7R14_02680 [Pseudomonas lini]|uniref:Uncharacterized protein n=1 Tax=Pseudomonas lini TaxID=163011 RepID=A0A7V7TNP7_9PSED|nr:hypothetical protein F7R14_02680 [Pseudomonas lini]MDT9677358.1 hypothetical protein [Pseudomonas sp. JV414]
MPAKNDNAVCLTDRGVPFAGKPRSYRGRFTTKIDFRLTIKKTIGDTPSWLWIYSSYSSTPPRC